MQPMWISPLPPNNTFNHKITELLIEMQSIDDSLLIHDSITVANTYYKSINELPCAPSGHITIQADKLNIFVIS